jgi:ribosomal protein S4
MEEEHAAGPRREGSRECSPDPVQDETVTIPSSKTTFKKEAQPKTTEKKRSRTRAERTRRRDCRRGPDRKGRTKATETVEEGDYNDPLKAASTKTLAAGEGAERLQKIIATAGITSRRKAEELILQGRVTVNRETVTELGAKADPTKDRIAVDGKLISASGPKIYVLLNKPWLT